MFKHILIPTDGSPVAAKAIKAGVALAKEMGASVTGYYAIQPAPTHIYAEGYLGDRRLVEELERRSREVARRFLDEISNAAKAAGVPCDTLVDKVDLPYKGIIQAAEQKNCDVVFMASHGHRGLTGLLIGSVTQQVLTHSKIPVLVFR
ncbi:MAG TPA: universal stress protein [Burkholderiales bacterium]|nr:universal stress protein [Burkholderiales bacterium]